MHSSTNSSNKTNKDWTFVPLFFKGIFLTIICAVLTSNLSAQSYEKPEWYFGLAGAVNFNKSKGSIREITPTLRTAGVYNEGDGGGFYFAPLVEYHLPNTILGGILQIGYDRRDNTFDGILNLCNCPATLETELTYISVEPSIRVAPFDNDFYLYGGIHYAFNVGSKYRYTEGESETLPERERVIDAKGEISELKRVRAGTHIGAGYDIQLSPRGNRTQMVISPFLAYYPTLSSRVRHIENWTMSTFRVGAAIKFGQGRISAPSVIDVIEVEPEPVVAFTVNSPTNVNTEKWIREVFPLRNYVFFDEGSTAIPARYNLLSRDQAKNFREEMFDLFHPVNPYVGRSDRQMMVYYNVLNIVGDRMVRNPAVTITLVGSTENSLDEAKAMAESVKTYLVSTFGIDQSRINTLGRDRPLEPAEKPGTGHDVLLHQDDRRVSIETTSPDFLMEYQTAGPRALLRPVEMKAIQRPPLSSYVTFNAAGAKSAFPHWNVEVRDETGKVQYFGPYTDEKVSIPGTAILGMRPSGNYTVTMVGTTKNGKVVKRESKAHVVAWSPSTNEEGMRFSVLFEFDEADAIKIYERYLTDVVASKIPAGGNVLIRGYTDTIGDEAHNKELSMARANEVKTILQKALTTAGRTDVTFDVHGYGEDPTLSPFENNLPEERYYNRTVVIDIFQR